MQKSSSSQNSMQQVASQDCIFEWELKTVGKPFLSREVSPNALHKRNEYFYKIDDELSPKKKPPIKHIE
jgi:hypothetical protein